MTAAQRIPLTADSIRKPRALLATILLAAACLLAVSAPAHGAYSHGVVETDFEVGAPCAAEIHDIAVLEPEGYVYVSCKTYVSGAATPDIIKRFDLNGNPVPFAGSAPYIAGNAIIADPGSATGVFPTFGSPTEIAVDSSSSPNHGKLYVASSPNVSIFDPSGLYVTEIEQPFETTVPNRLHGLDIGPEGSVYVTSALPAGRVSKYTPNYVETHRLYTGGGSITDPATDHIRIDSDGALWARRGAGGSAKIIRKYEANQFTQELKPKFGNPTPPGFLAVPSPFAANPLVSGTAANVRRFDVDLSDGSLYLNRATQIDQYSRGDGQEPAYVNAPSFGAGLLTKSNAIAVTSDHRVFASNEAEVIRFGPGDILPDVRTHMPQLDDVGHTDAVVRGRVELAGGAPITECKVEYGPTIAYASGSVPCSPDPADSPPDSNFAADTEVSATLTGLTEGGTYHYRLVASNEHGQNVGVDRVVSPAYVLKTETLPATDLVPDGVTLNASFDPDGMPTSYKFQYGVSTTYGFETDTQSGGDGSGVTTVSTDLSGLPSGRLFHYRVLATNDNGTTIGQDRTFRTASRPEISGVRTSDVKESSAVLHATVNPAGFETTYQFIYGTTADHGLSAPPTPLTIAADAGPTEVSQTITGLQAGTTYHFEMVAENRWGERRSGNTTFDYAPPACPNDHVRQQTKSAYLPDCRAYELVSPASAGAVILVPSRFATNKTLTPNNSPYSEEVPYMTNQGYANSPSRFTFWSAISTPDGLESPLGFVDMFMATRTNNGWVSSTPGLQGIEAYGTGRKECSDSMDLCVDHSESTNYGYQREGAPYMFTAEGEKRGRLPTNVHVIEDGNEYFGGQAMSRDFSHYVFSSSEWKTNFAEGSGPVFAPGGRSDGLGSAYDNDINARTVTVISKRPNGTDIELEGPKTLSSRGFDFPGVSVDGSHILMETPAPDSLSFLFLRVDQAITYDIAQGNPVTPVGMTPDGSKVYFTTAAKLTADDTDSSVDLYMWEEGGPQGELTRLSQGNGRGDTNSCNPTWAVSGCGVTPVTPDFAHPNQNRAIHYKGMDDQFAEESGDIYFYSPELLDPDRPGIANERNLYLYRQSSGVQLVATFDRGTQATRFQISADGDHAAMLTKSQLTSQDNAGFAQVYTYDANSGEIRCASCNPHGQPPTGDATVSQGGRFMSDDGRTFFSTIDRLVARDQNGSITDTYEYVAGRPQLISSGVGDIDYTGGTSALSLYLTPEYIGLEHVSRNGVDVFFSTFETLVSEDLNGSFVKFYVARSGGGFLRELERAPCAAADECRGEVSDPIAAPGITSNAYTGTGGNATAPNPAKKNAAKKKAAKKKAAQKKAAQKKRRAAKRKAKAQRRAKAQKRAQAMKRRNGRNG